ncbi:MAG: DUF6632 domain-containing protein [Candidatus Cybelea sp.]
MYRERALKIVLLVVGLLFSACILPLIASLWQTNMSGGSKMMLSIYAPLGVFLLLAAPNPSANRSLIAFTAWSSFVHAAVMAVMAIQNADYRGDLYGVAGLIVIGILLIVLAPVKQSGAGNAEAG